MSESSAGSGQAAVAASPRVVPAAGPPTRQAPRPGLIALLGSGETSPAGRRMHDLLLSRLPRPATVAILETPAGFQPNVERVAGKVAEFMQRSLRNHQPRVLIVQARQRGTPLKTSRAQGEGGRNTRMVGQGLGRLPVRGARGRALGARRGISLTPDR